MPSIISYDIFSGVGAHNGPLCSLKIARELFFMSRVAEYFLVLSLFSKPDPRMQPY